MKKIAIIVGTRPESIKLVPVYLAMLQSDKLKPMLISTGQHKEMLQQTFDFFGISPELELDIMVNNQTLAGLSSRLFEVLNPLFIAEGFETIIVQGDTTTAFVAAMVGFYNKIKVAHVEAGLRTYNKFSPFPEEVNRQIIGVLADYHFAPTKRATEVLLNEGKKNVFNVGNTVIDSLLLTAKRVKQNKSFYFEYFNDLDFSKKIILITGHRRENFGQGFENICNAIFELATIHPEILFVYPVHLNPNVQHVVHRKLTGLSNVRLIKPLPYDYLVFLMAQSYIILTDSGGIQEEAPSLNVPVIVMRENTERPEGVEAGCAALAGTNKEGIIKWVLNLIGNQSLYSSMVNVENPYGKGTSSQEIVKILESHVEG